MTFETTNRPNVVYPNDPKFKLTDLPPEVSLRLQEDALDALGDLVVFLAFEEAREEEAKDLLASVVDVLCRGGRL